MKNKFVVIICGDPRSTFNEILAKTLKVATYKNKFFPLVIVCSKNLLKDEFKKFKTKINFYNFGDFKNSNKNKIYVIDIPLNLKKLNLSKINSYIQKSFEVGLGLLKNNNTLGLINGPISKTSFLNGKFRGITEFLAHKTSSKNEVMLIFNKQLSVSPITTHIPINKVAQKIKKQNIVNNIKSINNFYKKFLKIKPKIAVTGLNPHCETFLGKNIEKTEISPAIKTLRGKKINVSGPFSADTIFLESNRKDYDVIVGMYHDQVLGPMKTIFGFNAINITIGLPFVRISPDHGPNFEMYGLNKSKPNSLIHAFNFLKKYANKT